MARGDSREVGAVPDDTVPPTGEAVPAGSPASGSPWWAQTPVERPPEPEPERRLEPAGWFREDQPQVVDPGIAFVFDLDPEPAALSRPEPAALLDPEPAALSRREPVARSRPEPAAVPDPEPAAFADPEPVALAKPAVAPVLPRPAPSPIAAAATMAAARRPRRRRRARWIIAGLVLLVPVAVLAVAAALVFQPFKGDGQGRGEVRVTIPSGASVRQIGDLLAARGVIDDGTLFSIRAHLGSGAGDLRAGTVRLRHDMSYVAALAALKKPPLPPATVRVSIPEGLSRREIADSIKRAGVRGSYLEASVRSPGFDPRVYSQPKGTRGLEGFLFPATYDLPRGGATAKRLVADQLRTFRKQIKGISMRRAHRAHLTRYDVLIIASMVEREVRVPAERRLVAAVIYNRLRRGMPLQIDATTRYATHNWTRPLTQRDLDRNSPYDTRNHVGLPPTPIGNPGRDSIEAAANPAKRSYLYYVVRPGGRGRHNFSSTPGQFNRDKAAYDRAQRREGGDPSGVTK